MVGLELPGEKFLSTELQVGQKDSPATTFPNPDMHLENAVNSAVDASFKVPRPVQSL